MQSTKMLHFETLHGATARSINSSIISFSSSVGNIEKNLEMVGLRNEKINIKNVFCGGVRCAHILSEKKNKEQKEKEKLSNLINIIKNSLLDPIVASLSLNIIKIILNNLKKISKINEINKSNVAKILKEIIIFSSVVSEINPIEISSNIIPVSWPNELSFNKNKFEIVNKALLIEMLKDIPTSESKWPAPACDFTGIAMLKSVSNGFGPRGGSCITESSIGVSKKYKNVSFTQSIICEPKKVKTREIAGKNSSTEAQILFEISAYIDRKLNIEEVIQRISYMGAISIHTNDSFLDNHKREILLTATVNFFNKKNVARSIFKHGKVSNIIIKQIENQTIRKRKINISLGRNQRKYNCLFEEWILEDEIIHIEPSDQDLAAISRKTGFDINTIRNDAIDIWNKLNSVI